MKEWMLYPWMLRADWRDDSRALVIVDLDEWPRDIALDPLPPVPVIAIGAQNHPQAARADLIVEPPFTLASLVDGICGMPRAAATLVQLLRVLEGIPAEKALPTESFAFAMLQGGAEHAAWRTGRPAVPTLPPGTLHVQRNAGTLDLLIDRPHAHNAIDRAMRDALYEAFSLAALDLDIERVRLRAQGRIFGVGADLAEFGTTRDPAEAHAIRARTLPAHVIARRAGIIDVHVQGGCVGSSLEMAAFAGRFTATSDAWFQLPEVAMGILPGFGGCVSVPARIGRQRAIAMMLSGKRIPAKTALRWGLVDAIVDDASVDDRGTNEVG